MKQDLKILVLSSTLGEIGPVMEFAKAEAVRQGELYTAHVGNCQVDFLITGVGLTAAAASIAAHLVNEDYVVMIQVGIAGSLTEELSIGDVTMVSSDLIADEGVLRDGKWNTLADLGLASKEEKNEGIVCHFVKDRLDSGMGHHLRAYKLVKAVSVNTISSSRERAHELAERFGAQIETMEGAAFFHIASKRKDCQYMNIRGISNYAGDPPSMWNIPLAIENINVRAIRVVKHLSFYRGVH